MKTTLAALGILVGLLAGQADARHFGWTVGANCCVDQFHYFSCHSARSLQRGCNDCEYRGYSISRTCTSGTYDLFSAGCSPKPNLSSAYTRCPSQQGTACNNGYAEQGGTSHLYDMLFQ